MEEFETVIGLEIHVELKTKTKLFCNCEVDFGRQPNTLVCPVCLGLPGSLPVVNKEAIIYAIKVAKALDAKINTYSKFDRKNYFYPDMPKNYQISQYDMPFSNGGYIELFNGKKIEFERIHIEEDTGKSIHLGSDRLYKSEGSLIDYNRAGVPLIEMVTKPQLSSSNEVIEFLKNLILILRYLGVSDCKMEEGSLRCDVNVSVNKKGEGLGTKVEIKNMNSFRFLKNAIDYEIKRQIQLIKEGKKIVQETRGWDEKKKITFTMRRKEKENDYRYFPEPDLLPLVITDDLISQAESDFVKLHFESQKEYKEYGLDKETIDFILSDINLRNYFDGVLTYIKDPKLVAKWMKRELGSYLNKEKKSISFVKLTHENFAKLLIYLKEGKITNNIAKEIFYKIIDTDEDVDDIISKNNYQIDDNIDNMLNIIYEVLDNNKVKVSQYLSGKTKLFGYFMGQIMKASKGRFNPKNVSEILKKELEKRG